MEQVDVSKGISTISHHSDRGQSTFCHISLALIENFIRIISISSDISCEKRVHHTIEIVGAIHADDFLEGVEGV